MTQQKHTPEPWATGDMLIRYGDLIMLNSDDFSHARDCVNALAGIPDPEEFVKAAKELLKFSKLQAAYSKKGLLPLIGEWTEINNAIARAEAAFGGVE